MRNRRADDQRGPVMYGRQFRIGRDRDDGQAVDTIPAILPGLPNAGEGEHAASRGRSKPGQAPTCRIFCPFENPEAGTRQRRLRQASRKAGLPAIDSARALISNGPVVSVLYPVRHKPHRIATMRRIPSIRATVCTRLVGQML